MSKQIGTRWASDIPFFRTKGDQTKASIGVRVTLFVFALLVATSGGLTLGKVSLFHVGKFNLFKDLGKIYGWSTVGGAILLIILVIALKRIKKYEENESSSSNKRTAAHNSANGMGQSNAPKEQKTTGKEAADMRWKKHFEPQQQAVPSLQPVDTKPISSKGPIALANMGHERVIFTTIDGAKSKDSTIVDLRTGEKEQSSAERVHAFNGEKTAFERFSHKLIKVNGTCGSLYVYQGDQEVYQCSLKIGFIKKIVFYEDKMIVHYSNSTLECIQVHSLTDKTLSCEIELEKRAYSKIYVENGKIIWVETLPNYQIKVFSLTGELICERSSEKELYYVGNNQIFERETNTLQDLVTGEILTILTQTIRPDIVLLHNDRLIHLWDLIPAGEGGEFCYKIALTTKEGTPLLEYRSEPGWRVAGMDIIENQLVVCSYRTAPRGNKDSTISGARIQRFAL